MQSTVGKYCTYSHLIDGVAFYVGAGRLQRSRQRIGRNPIWREIIKYHGGYDIRIIATFTTMEEALHRETIEIKKQRPIANLYKTSWRPKMMGLPNTSNHGGKRRNAGRPPVSNRCKCGLMSAARALKRGHICHESRQKQTQESPVMDDRVLDYGAFSDLNDV